MGNSLRSACALRAKAFAGLVLRRTLRPGFTFLSAALRGFGFAFTFTRDEFITSSQSTDRQLYKSSTGTLSCRGLIFVGRPRSTFRTRREPLLGNSKISCTLCLLMELIKAIRPGEFKSLISDQQVKGAAYRRVPEERFSPGTKRAPRAANENKAAAGQSSR